MFIRRSFVTLFAIAIFVIQVVLFAQEGGEDCTVGPFTSTQVVTTLYGAMGGPLQSTPPPNPFGKVVTTETTEVYGDSVCVSTPYSCNCYLQAASPATRITTTVEHYAYAQDGIYTKLDEEIQITGGGSYVMCGD